MGDLGGRVATHKVANVAMHHPKSGGGGLRATPAIFGVARNHLMVQGWVSGHLIQIWGGWQPPRGLGATPWARGGRRHHHVNVATVERETQVVYGGSRWRSPVAQMAVSEIIQCFMQCPHQRRFQCRHVKKKKEKKKKKKE